MIVPITNPIKDTKIIRKTESSILFSEIAFLD